MHEELSLRRIVRSYALSSPERRILSMVVRTTNLYYIYDNEKAGLFFHSPAAWQRIEFRPNVYI